MITFKVLFAQVKLSTKSLCTQIAMQIIGNLIANSEMFYNEK